MKYERSHLIPKNRTEKEVQTLVEQYQGLVKRVQDAKFYDLRRDEDLRQCGLIGLWKAAEHWQCQGNFESYARKCVFNSMLDHKRALDRENRIVKVSYQERSKGEDWENSDYNRDDGYFCNAEDLPTHILPTIQEEKIIDDSVFMANIHSVFPRGSTERNVLESLATNAATKKQLAEDMGISTYQVTKLARRAYQKLKDAVQEE